MNRNDYNKGIKGLTAKYSKDNPEIHSEVLISESGIVITLRTKTALRKEWAREVLEEYHYNYERESEILLCDPHRKVMVVQFKSWFCEGIGISKCSPNDDFDEEIGLAVAFAKFIDEPIPDFV